MLSWVAIFVGQSAAEEFVSWIHTHSVKIISIIFRTLFTNPEELQYSIPESALHSLIISCSQRREFWRDSIFDRVLWAASLLRIQTGVVRRCSRPSRGVFHDWLFLRHFDCLFERNETFPTWAVRIDGMRAWESASNEPFIGSHYPSQSFDGTLARPMATNLPRGQGLTPVVCWSVPNVFQGLDPWDRIFSCTASKQSTTEMMDCKHIGL